jgi:hypothetical protein
MVALWMSALAQAIRVPAGMWVPSLSVMGTIAKRWGATIHVSIISLHEASDLRKIGGLNL